MTDSGRTPLECPHREQVKLWFIQTKEAGVLLQVSAINTTVHGSALSSWPNLALSLSLLWNYSQSSPCTSQSCGKAYVQQRRRYGGEEAWTWRGLGAVYSVHECLLLTLNHKGLHGIVGTVFSLTEDSWCVTSVPFDITFTMISQVWDSPSYWLEIWRMHPWPIWVLIAGPSGLRHLHPELKSKPCVNLHSTLTPRSRSLGFCKINHLKLLCPVSSVQISLPIPNYLLVIQHCSGEGEDLDVEARRRSTVMWGGVSTLCNPQTLFLSCFCSVFHLRAAKCIKFNQICFCLFVFDDIICYCKSTPSANGRKTARRKTKVTQNDHACTVCKLQQSCAILLVFI